MNRLSFLRAMLLAGGTCCALLLGALPAVAQQYDQSSYDTSQPNPDQAQSPGRVARLAYLSGQVQFAPAGESDWGSVEINRPMVIGDRLLTGDDGRAVLELGDASVRVDNDSAFDFLNLDDNNVQIELSQGTLNLSVHQMADGENFEVDTPTVAFVAAAPGVYRIDDDPTGTGSMVTVFQGSGTVYGENGASRQVVAGTSYRFNDSALASVDVNGLPQPDGFDRFCEARDTNYQNYAQQQQQYVPPDMIGGDDLYQYGQWNDTPEYGNVWYPSSVPVGWAPYRYGHWAWIDPWGWTWVDDQPWGFAPFHYGRWAYIGNRWGWMPGPVGVQPVYAPALVAFIGGSGFSLAVNLGGGGPVGWFPLGPRDVYVPWFRASRNYFTNVNVTNIRNVYVNKTVINNFYGDYRAGRVPPRGGHNYAYRNLPNAVTAVPRNVFTEARPVQPAVLRLDRNQIARTQVALRPDAIPGNASLGLRRPVAKQTVLRDRQPFTRPVVARHQPPPRPVAFADREKVIASQHGQPLTPTQLQDLRRTQPATGQRNDRVKLVPVVAGAATGAAALGTMRHGTTPARPAEPGARPVPAARPEVTQRAAEPSARRVAPGEQPVRNTVQPPRVEPHPQPERQPGELPSARFAHPGEARTLPRAAVIRPAGEAQTGTQGRLPVVRPVERAPQAQDQHAGQRTPQGNPEAQQRDRQQQMLQQREAQEQSQQQQRLRAQQADQQRARDQQMQQQRDMQMQQQRQAQMQQQREAQMQNEQRARDQQAQQQRDMQMQQQRQAQMQQQREAQMQNEQRARDQQMQQQRQMQVQQQREAQMQQTRVQQSQRTPERTAPRQAPEHRAAPPRQHPPESSGNPFR